MKILTWRTKFVFSISLSIATLSVFSIYYNGRIRVIAFTSFPSYTCSSLEMSFVSPAFYFV